MEPVVLLHSSGWSGKQWRTLVDALTPRYHVHAPDFIGSGERPLWAEREIFHFDLDVDEIVRLCEPIAPVHLVGHSYGGFIAACVARRRPSLLRSLSLYDPVCYGVLYDVGDAEGLSDLDHVEHMPGFLEATTGGDDAWMRHFVDYWNGAGAWDQMPRPFRAGLLRAGKKVFGEVTSLLRDRTPCAAYRPVTAPTLLLGGAKSPPAVRRVVALLGEAFPDARVEVLADAGHMGPLTHAEAVNAAIEGHLTASVLR
jgi:pimeloyl-ACP methyl ester carboxylesterase